MFLRFGGGLWKWHKCTRADSTWVEASMQICTKTLEMNVFGSQRGLSHGHKCTRADSTWVSTSMQMCKNVAKINISYFWLWTGLWHGHKCTHAGNEVQEAAADDDARALHQNDCNQRSQILFIMESNSTWRKTKSRASPPTCTSKSASRHALQTLIYFYKTDARQHGEEDAEHLQARCSTTCSNRYWTLMRTYYTCCGSCSTDRIHIHAELCWNSCDTCRM